MAHKILVVDDEANSLNLAVKVLTREGYEVVTAVDGDDALKRIEQEKPEVVILDLIMPKRNGFEVLSEIRTRYEHWIPVIINSAQGDLESVRKGYSLEADHYLTKPTSMEHLLAGVRTMISLIPLHNSSSEGGK